MQKSLEILSVSLHVLTVINNRQLPAQSDIDMITAFAGPRPDGLALDEFICDVIRAATEQRAIPTAASRSAVFEGAATM